MNEKQVKNALARLNREEAYVLRGILDGKKYIIIGKEMGVGEERISQHATPMYKAFGLQGKEREKLRELTEKIMDRVAPFVPWKDWKWPTMGLLAELQTKASQPVSERRPFQVIAAIAVIGLIIVGILFINSLNNKPAIQAALPTLKSTLTTLSPVLSPTLSIPTHTLISPTKTIDTNILFFDDFDNGWSKDWIITRDGEPVVAQGKLTVQVVNSAKTGGPGVDAWFAKEANWTDYRVDLDYDVFGSSGGMVAIGVRFNDGTFYMANVSSYWSSWIKNPIIGTMGSLDNAIAGTRVQKRFDLPAKISVVCQGQKLILMVNGSAINTIISDGNKSGGVVLYLSFNTLVDNFKVTKLP
jgi:hypothetical protein